MGPSDAGEDYMIEEPEPEVYNPTGARPPAWQPHPHDILTMFTQLETGQVLPLKWVCGGRRAPEKEAPDQPLDFTSDEEEEEDDKDEEKRVPEPSAFDFDDTASEISSNVLKMTPRTPASAKSKRPEKKVARMDNVLSSLKRRQKADREARKSQVRALGASGPATPHRAPGTLSSRLAASSIASSPGPASRPGSHPGSRPGSHPGSPRGGALLSAGGSPAASRVSQPSSPRGAPGHSSPAASKVNTATASDTESLTAGKPLLPNSPSPPNTEGKTAARSGSLDPSPPPSLDELSVPAASSAASSPKPPAAAKKTEKPSSSGKPKSSGKPVGLVKPVKSVKPASSEKSVKLHRPASVEKPVSSGKPVSSEKPVKSDKPVSSGDPVSLEKPASPDKPLSSEAPASSGKPVKSEKAATEKPLSSESALVGSGDCDCEGSGAGDAAEQDAGMAIKVEALAVKSETNPTASDGDNAS